MSNQQFISAFLRELGGSKKICTCKHYENGIIYGISICPDGKQTRKICISRSRYNLVFRGSDGKTISSPMKGVVDE